MIKICAKIQQGGGKAQNTFKIKDLKANGFFIGTNWMTYQRIYLRHKRLSPALRV
jgi:hypothetical protein